MKTTTCGWQKRFGNCYRRLKMRGYSCGIIVTLCGAFAKAESLANIKDQELTAKLIMNDGGRMCADPEGLLPYAEECHKRGQIHWKKRVKLYNDQHAEAAALRKRGIKQVDLEFLPPGMARHGAVYLHATLLQLGRIDEATKVKDEFFAMLKFTGMSPAEAAYWRYQFFWNAGLDGQATQELARTLELTDSREDQQQVFTELAMMGRYGTPDDQLTIAQAVEIRSRKLPEGERSSGLVTLGFAQLRKEIFAGALDTFGKVLELRGEEARFSHGTAWQQSLRCQALLGQWEQGRDNFIQNVIAPKRNQKDQLEDLLNHLNHLATITAQAGFLQEAKAAFEEAETLLMKIKQPDEWSRSSYAYRMGLTAFQVGIYPKTTEYFLEARKNPEMQISLAPYFLALSFEGKTAELAKEREAILAEMRGAYAKQLRFQSEGQVSKDYKRAELMNLMLNTGTDSLTVEIAMAFKGLASDLRAAGMADQAGLDVTKKTSDWRIKFADKRERLAQLSLKAPGKMSKTEATQLEKVAAELAAMERTIGESKRRSETVASLQWKLSDWENKLPAATVGVNYLRYGKYAVKDPTKKLNDPLTTTAWYGAAVFGPGVTPRFVELGRASEIDAFTKEFRSLVATRKAGETHPDARLEELCKTLHRLLVAPVEKDLPAVAKLALSLDGTLHFLPFGVLMDDTGTPLFARREFNLVASFRTADLKSTSSLPSTGKVLLVGGVDYSGKATTENTAADHRGETRVSLWGGLESLPAGFSFKSLPGTATEIDRLGKLFQAKSWQTVSLVGQQATELAVQQVEKPQIIHLATHGYFLDVTNTTADLSASIARKSVDPMAYVGVALAGAQPTLQSWRSGTFPPMRDDGLMLASELAAQNLTSVELLVLSACETAVGELMDGESVAGFGKGCAQAGVKRALLTLWPIADDATVAIMESFYQKLLAGDVSPNQALRSAQSEAFSKTKTASGLRNAIYLTLPFVLIETGARVAP